MRLFWICLFCSLRLFSQQTSWETLTLQDGLSNGTVFDLLQDREGYFWMATKASLNRYDGYNFKLFTPHSAPSYTISSNQPTALFEDTHGRLWIGTQTGELNLYDSQTQRFYKCFFANQNGLINQHIFSIAEDKQHNLWVGTLTGGIYKIILPSAIKEGGFPKSEDFSNEVKVIALKTPLLATERVSFIKLLKNGELMVGSKGGLAQIDYFKNRYIPIPFPEEFRNLLLSVFEENDGSLIITARNKVIKWSHSKVELLLSLNDKPETLIRVNDKGEVLILRGKKMYKAHYTQLSPEIFQTQPVLDSVNFSLFTALKSDKNGYNWVSGGGYGLFREVRDRRKFEHKLKGRSIWRVYEDASKRLITSSFMRMYIADANDVGTPKERYFKEVHDCQGDGMGGYWQLRTDSVSHETMTLFHLDHELKVREQLGLGKIAIGENFGRITVLAQGYLMISGLGSTLIKIDTRSKKIYRYSYEQVLTKNTAVNHCYIDCQGICWLSTRKGLLKAVSDPLKGYKFELFRHKPKEATSLADDLVAMTLDDPQKPNDYLWVATNGGGLDRFDKKTQRFQHFTTQNGLPSDYVVSMLGDNKGNLWLGTYRGLASFNTTTFHCTTYSLRDGLQSNEFMMGSCFKTADGRMMFGGVNGLNIFHPEQLQRKKKSNVPIINQLKINNKEVVPFDETGVLAQSIERTNEIDLNYQQNQLQLGFAFIDFENGAENRFRYQLVGIDKDWVDIGTAHQIMFSQLAEGAYIFRLSGSEDGSQWSKPVELKLTIHPPFYRSWWAFLLYAVLCIWIITRFYKAQLNRVRLQQELVFKNRETERLAELDQLKSNFFTNISHEFRTPLTLILPPIVQLAKQNPTVDLYQMIERNAQRLLELINQLLDLSKLEAGQLRVVKEMTPLSIYFRTLVSAFQSLAESKNIRFEFNQNQENVAGEIDKDKVEKIVTNLLSNAFKFTEPNGRVRVEIDYGVDKKSMTLEVMDEGIGMSEEKLLRIFERFYQIEESPNRRFEGTGIGLALVKELVDVLQGTIEVESKLGKGTTFKVKLPVQYEYTEQGTTAVLVGGVKTQTEEVPASKRKKRSLGDDATNIVLIVDDNADIRKYVSSIFEADYEVVEAANGNEGFQKALEIIPSLIISDLMMPEVDGLTFCRWLKSDEKTSHIPIIMLTAKAELASRIESWELGADEYLLKPFSVAEMEARANNLLQKQQRLRQHFAQIRLDVKPSEVKANSQEERFVQKLILTMEAHLSNGEFTAQEFAQEMNMSQTQLLRKLKALTNLTINEFMRDCRLQRAADLLSQQAGSISDVAFQLGFTNLSYFGRIFKKKFGVLPSEYPPQEKGDY